MTEKPVLSFSETMPGTVWKTIADTENKRLFVEVRDIEAKRVSFAALDLEASRWLWQDQTFDEPWWISLGAVSGQVLLFTLYTDAGNPDKKSVLAFHVEQQQVLWWKNDFSITSLQGGKLRGIQSKFGYKEVILEVATGADTSENVVLADEQNFPVIRPFQYPEGHAYFQTVKSFLETRYDISPVFSVEYCEHHALILVSVFTGKEDLANYLIVLNSKGEMVMKETLGEHLKGIASDTFFIFSGYLIFVKNKRELVSYKLV